MSPVDQGDQLSPAKLRRFANKMIAWQQRYESVYFLSNPFDADITKRVSKIFNDLGLVNEVVRDGLPEMGFTWDPSGLIELKPLSDNQLFETQFKDSYAGVDEDKLRQRGLDT